MLSGPSSLTGMLRIGLTGGIGSGKSTVSRRLVEHGALVVDADVVAREVVEPGTPGLAEVVERFGPDVLRADGSLDRPALGRVVFSDEAARRDLEAITHPRIMARTRELFAAARPDQVLVHDVPLLVELGQQYDHHLVLVVHADAETRLERLVRDRGMSEDDARARIAAQASDDQRRAAADVWLPNEGTVDDLLERVDLLWEERLAPYDRNLLSRRSVRRPSRVELRDPDPSWPGEAALAGGRVAARLRDAGFGDLPVDHIGSTSVPGLPAKDVLDLQVRVPDLHLVETPAFEEALLAAGLADLHARQDDLHEWEPRADAWRKYLAHGCDPARVVHLHIRPDDGPGATLALDFRDWLRDDASARDEYAAMKRQAAAEHPGGSEQARGDYTAAKAPWFAEHLPRMREWAARR